jgi:hypothetical protein
MTAQPAPETAPDLAVAETDLAALPPLPRQRPQAPDRSHDVILAKLATPVATALSQPATRAPASNPDSNPASSPVSAPAATPAWRPTASFDQSGTASSGFGGAVLPGLDVDGLFGGRVGTGVAGTLGASALTDSPAGLDEALGQGEFFGGRVRVNFSDANSGEFVQDIVGANGVMMTDLSEADAYWERETKVEVDVLRTPGASLSFAGSYSDERTPDTGGRSLLNMGGVTGWSESSSQDLGARLGLFGDRLTYAGGLGFSRRDGASLLEEDGDDEEQSNAQSGAGQWHRFDAKVLDGDDIGLSFYGLYGLSDEGFSAGEAASEAGLDDTGETREMGGSFEFSSVGLTVKHKVNAGLDGKNEELSGTLDFNLGLADLSLSRNLQTSYDGESSGWSSRSLSHGADLTFDLEEYRGFGEDGFEVASLVPSSVTLGASVGEVESGSGGASDLEQGFGLGLEWYGEASSTSIDVWRDFTDSRAADYESADNEYWTLDMSQEFYGQAWDLSFNLSFSRDAYLETDASSLTTDVYGGVSFSYYADGLPDLSVAFDLGGYQWSEEDYAGSDTTMEFATSLDFSKFLPATGGDFEPYLKLNYYAQQVTTEDSDTGSTAEWGHAAMVKGGFQF